MTKLVLVLLLASVAAASAAASASASAAAGPAAAASATARADEVPTWPEPVVNDGEAPLHGVFPSTIHWLSGDGTPVTFQAVSIRRSNRNQIVLRAITASGSQDIATSNLPDAEFFVFDHDNGETVGLQLHRYTAGPDLYQGWVVRWTGQRLKIARTTRFNGKQPQPGWLVDSVAIPDRQRARRAIQTLRWGGHRADRNAFSHFFDDQPVNVTWHTLAADGTPVRRDESLTGTELLGRLAADGLPQVGHHATCKVLCCTADATPLIRWRRITRVCFDAEPRELLAFPHVRSIEIALP